VSRNRSDAARDRNGAKRAGQRRHEGAANGRLTAAVVADYLRRHPDFLAENPDLLEVISPPSRFNGNGNGGVVDLQQAMVERLRHEIAEITAARDDLVALSRGNGAAQTRVHRAVIALLSARSFEQLIEIVTTDLAVMLDLDVVTLGVESAGGDGPPVRVNGIVRLEPDTVDALIGQDRALRQRPDIQGDPMIFGAGAGLVASDALIRLSISERTPTAMLALGSGQADQFHPGQGSELLCFLGQAVENAIRGWLRLPD